MVGIGASGGNSSQSSGSYIDRVQRDYLHQIYGRAAELSNQPRSFYPNSTVTPYSPESEEGLARTASIAREGSGVVGAGLDYAKSVLHGDYLDPNKAPYLRDTYDAAARDVRSNFMRSVLPGASLGAYGRGGSGREANRQATAYDQILGRNLNELGTSIYGGNYARERGYQNQVASQLPMYADQQYSDANRLREVGGAREDLSRRYLEELMQRYSFGQDEPRQRLSEFQQMLGSPTVLQWAHGHASNWGANASVLGG